MLVNHLQAKRAGLLLLALSTTTLLAGCFGSTKRSFVENSPPVGESVVRLNVAWQQFSSIQAQSTSAIQALSWPVSRINVVGARLEYPNENAAFIQSVTRQVAEEVGVITLRVPPTDKAHLFVVAVDSEANVAARFGVRRDISIPANSILDISLNDLTWYEATWQADKYWDQLQSGGIHVTESDIIQDPVLGRVVKIPIRVRDPFQIGQRPQWDNLLIRVWGSSSWSNNDAGWRPFTMSCSQQRDGNKCQIQPYIPASAFKLTESPRIPPIIPMADGTTPSRSANPFTVYWP